MEKLNGNLDDFANIARAKLTSSKKRKRRRGKSKTDYYSVRPKYGKSEGSDGSGVKDFYKLM